MKYDDSHLKFYQPEPKTDSTKQIILMLGSKFCFAIFFLTNPYLYNAQRMDEGTE